MTAGRIDEALKVPEIAVCFVGLVCLASFNDLVLGKVGLFFCFSRRAFVCQSDLAMTSELGTVRWLLQAPGRR